MLTSQATPEIEQLSRKKARLSGYPEGGNRFDWLALGLAVFLNGGLYLDGWAHNRGESTSETFFTPWHALLYGTYLLTALFFVIVAIQNHTKGYPLWRSLPKGYNLALPGLILFGLGILGEIFWYLVFGTNADTDPLLRPSRLVLAFSGLLVLSTPFRAVLFRVQVARPGWRELAPALISGGLVLAVLTFYTGYSQPFIEKNPASTPTDQLWGTDLYLMSPDGSAKTRLTSSNSFSSWLPRISPDGKRIVFTSGENGKKTDQLYIMDLDGSNRVQLTNLPGSNAWPTWSPDGTTIAFNSGLEGNTEIYTIKPDGSELRRLTNNPGDDMGPVWSPDGQSILFYSQKDGDYKHLYLMRPDGSEQTRLTSDNWDDITGSFSPDGNQIIFSSYRDVTFQIYRMNRDGTNLVRLTNDSHDNWYPEWSPDGSSITFMSGKYQVRKIDIYRMKPDGSEPTNLTQNGVGVMSQIPYWSPDGSKIIYSTTFPLEYSQFLALYQTSDLGIGSLSVQAALLIGLLLFLLRRWVLPLGALTLVMTLSIVLVSVIQERYELVVVALVAGVITEALRWLLKPFESRKGKWRNYLFAFAVPFLFYGLYLQTLQFSRGISWASQLAVGVPIIAGLVGILMVGLGLFSSLSREPTPQPTTVYELQGRLLLLARFGWMALVALTIIVSLVGIPYYLQNYQVCNSWNCIAPETAKALENVGIPVQAYIAFSLIADNLISLLCLGTAFVIFWKLSRQWIGLVASYALIIGSAATYFTPLIYSADHSIWLNRNKPNYSFDGWFYTGRFLESFSVLTILLLFALFPNGRFVPRWIRWPLILFIAVRLYYLIYTDLLDWGEWVQWTISLTDWVCVLSVIVAQIYRYRRVSTPVERQQTKWLVFSGVAWWLVRYSSGLPSDSGFNINLSDTLYWPLSRLINYSFSFFLVASFILALFRQRLWGIDLVINRTLVYGTLTLTVILLYLSLVLGLNTLFQQTIQGNLLISMLATVVIALLFQPLRHKLQRAVNRYMYGERDDPYGVLARLGQRLEGTLAPEQVLPTIVETVAQTLKLPYAAIELAYSSTSTLVLAETSGETSKPGEVAATYGTPGPTSSLTRFPLSYQSETVGYLVLRARAGEKLGRSDQRLLKDLTHQVGIAVSAVKLTLDLKRLAQDLQQARELLVTTREEERRRLRRDLHDGLGPTLASLSFKMEAARNLLGPGNERVDALLSNISQQTQQTITEIRQLVYSLRPPALDELGLILAIKEQAAQQQLPTLRIGVEAPESLPELSAAVEVAAYRIVQEAITNVVRHAKATKCVIRIETRNQTLLIEVMDDGQGISPAHRSGVGLRAMYERASELGGSCTIQPGQDRGTVVQVKLHLPTLKVRAALVQEVLN